MARNTPRDKVVDEYMEIFKQAYAESSSDRRRMVEMQKMFDNVVDESTWPTTAKLSIPMMFSFVMKNIPHTWQAMFPQSNWARLMPAEEEIDIEQLKNSEFALNYTLKRRMRLNYKAYPAVLDSYKFAVGFGIVEPCLVTPMRSYLNKIYNENREEVASARVIGAAAPKRSVRFRYIVPGQIVVTKDGTGFNGDDRVSVPFFVDQYSEAGFRDLVAGDDRMKGVPVDKIIEEARKNVFDARTPIVNTVASLAGVSIRNTTTKGFPVRIPVVKVYAEKRHIWIANGTTRILDVESDEVMRCPLMKATSSQDGQRFYPMGIAEACQKPWFGYNIYVSGLYDILNYALTPLLAYDKTKAGTSVPERGGNGMIGTYGPVRDSIAYLSPPQIGADVFSVGDRMLSMIDDVTNKGASMQAGMVRGGGFALADLMKSTYGQQVMGDTFMALGFLQPCVDHTIALMQELITDGADKFILRDYNPQTEEEYIKEITVTEDDLMHSYDVELNLKDIEGSSAMAMSTKQAEFDRLSKSEFADQYEVLADYLGDDEKARRVLFTRKRVKEMQEERRIAELERQSRPKPSAPGTNPMTEAMAGAGATALAGQGSPIAPPEAL